MFSQVLIAVPSAVWHYVLLLFPLLQRFGSGQDTKSWQGIQIL